MATPPCGSKWRHLLIHGKETVILCVPIGVHTQLDTSFTDAYIEVKRKHGIL